MVSLWFPVGEGYVVGFFPNANKRHEKACRADDSATVPQGERSMDFAFVTCDY